MAGRGWGAPDDADLWGPDEAPAAPHPARRIAAAATIPNPARIAAPPVLMRRRGSRPVSQRGYAASPHAACRGGAAVRPRGWLPPTSPPPRRPAIPRRPPTKADPLADASP